MITDRRRGSAVLAHLRSRWAVMAHDITMVPLAWLFSQWAHVSFAPMSADQWGRIEIELPIVIACQVLMLWYFGLYRGIWRFASLPDLVRILKAVTSGVVLAGVVTALFYGVGESLRERLVELFRNGLYLTIFLGGPRLVYRWFRDRGRDRSQGQRVLIVGAGASGEMLAREMLRDANRPYLPIGFVDDDANKVEKEIRGLRVYGTSTDLPKLVEDLDIDAIVIAMPSASAREIRRVVGICEASAVPVRILPRDYQGGEDVRLNDLRDVGLEDLLGRDPVQLDWQSIAGAIQGKTVLITGAGGSIGSELCRQTVRMEPSLLVAFDHSEYSLYSIELELRQSFPAIKLVTVLGDVGDEVAVDAALRKFKPQIIYHAAAYKHVPILEGQVRSAVQNNVIGTHTLATLADRHECETFVQISSDKAVNPANVMGMTKRVAEMICQDIARRSKTSFMTVRFGNVLGSSGSVVPLFQQQIARGGPVTVTHPQVTRYFMTTQEACQLILQASAIGRGGEIFVLDMGEPVRIAQLAEQLIRLAGKRRDDDVEIVFTGLRPGEKLTEELFHDSEKLSGTSHPKIMRANCRMVDAKTIESQLATMIRASREFDDTTLRVALVTLVPENSIQPNRTTEEARPTATIIPLVSAAARDVREG